jgi:hypothetical protein
MATAYIETTVPSYYVARPSNSLLQAARQANTRAWWDGGCSGFDLFVSQETLDETGRGEKAMAKDRLALIQDLPMLEVSDTAAALTRTLLAKGLIPTKAASDAIQRAVASVHAIDYLDMEFQTHRKPVYPEPPARSGSRLRLHVARHLHTRGTPER